MAISPPRYTLSTGETTSNRAVAENDAAWSEKKYGTIKTQYVVTTDAGKTYPTNNPDFVPKENTQYYDLNKQSVVTSSGREYPTANKSFVPRGTGIEIGSTVTTERGTVNLSKGVTGLVTELQHRGSSIVPYSEWGRGLAAEPQDSSARSMTDTTVYTSEKITSIGVQPAQQKNYTDLEPAIHRQPDRWTATETLSNIGYQSQASKDIKVRVAGQYYSELGQGITGLWDTPIAIIKNPSVLVTMDEQARSDPNIAFKTIFTNPGKGLGMVAGELLGGLALSVGGEFISSKMPNIKIVNDLVPAGRASKTIASTKQPSYFTADIEQVSRTIQGKTQVAKRGPSILRADIPKVGKAKLTASFIEYGDITKTPRGSISKGTFDISGMVGKQGIKGKGQLIEQYIRGPQGSSETISTSAIELFNFKKGKSLNLQTQEITTGVTGKTQYGFFDTRYLRDVTIIKQKVGGKPFDIPDFSTEIYAGRKYDILGGGTATEMRRTTLTPIGPEVSSRLTKSTNVAFEDQIIYLKTAKSTPAIRESPPELGLIISDRKFDIKGTAFKDFREFHTLNLGNEGRQGSTTQQVIQAKQISINPKTDTSLGGQLGAVAKVISTQATAKSSLISVQGMQQGLRFIPVMFSPLMNQQSRITQERQASKVFTGMKQTPFLSNIQRMILSPMLIQPTMMGMDTKLGQAQDQKISSIQRTTQTHSSFNSIGMTTTTIPPPPIPPPPIIIPGGGFMIGDIEETPKKRGRGRPPKFSTRYIPSITALEFNIQGRQSKSDITGLSVRPIATREKPRKRTKKTSDRIQYGIKSSIIAERIKKGQYRSKTSNRLGL